MKDIAKAQSRAEGVIYKPSWMGTVGSMEFMIRVIRVFGGENNVFPTLQGMHYMVSMFSGAEKLEPLEQPIPRPGLD